MTPLGKCLTFYFKYPAEMKRLYEKPLETGEEPDLSGLQDAEKVLEKIRTVGDGACKDAASFLRDCIGVLEPHFGSIGNFKQTRRNLEDKWSAMYQLWLQGSTARSWVGVYLNEQLRLVVPWFWTQQRNYAEAARILGVSTSLGEGIPHDAGTLVLARIEVSIPEDLKSLDIDRKPLIEQVRRSFDPFTSGTLAALAKLSLRE